MQMRYGPDQYPTRRILQKGHYMALLAKRKAHELEAIDQILSNVHTEEKTPLRWVLFSLSLIIAKCLRLDPEVLIICMRGRGAFGGYTTHA